MLTGGKRTFLAVFEYARWISCTPLGNDLTPIWPSQSCPLALRCFKGHTSDQTNETLSVVAEGNSWIRLSRQSVEGLEALTHASAVTKLVDGGEVKELFADVGLQLDGVKSYLKRLKLLNCYSFPSMDGFPQEQRGTQEEQSRITTKNPSPSHSCFFIYHRTGKRVLFILLQCAALNLDSDAVFSTGAGSPAGPQIRNAAHSPANYMQIFNGYF